jgi:hypothetical protein
MPFDTRVEASHQLGLSTAVEMALQQMGSKLRPYVSEKPASGEAIPASDLVGPVVAQRGSGRRRSNIENPAPFERRWLEYKDPLETGQYLDKEDTFRSAMNPASEIIKTHTNAMGRGIDDIILGLEADGSVGDGGILGTVKTGKRLSGSSVFPATNTIVHGGAGLTIAKLRAVRKKLSLAENDMDRVQAVMAIGAEQADNLLGIAEATAANLNPFEQRQLESGKITQLMGFKFVEINRLPLSSTTRTCPVWLPEMVVLGVWQDVVSNMWNDTSARNTPYMHIDCYIDCARKQDGGVFAIECTE